MAPPRWKQGWTGNAPPPAGAVLLNGASPTVARIGGAGPWTQVPFGNLVNADNVLQLVGPSWVETNVAALPGGGGIILGQ